MDVVGYLFLLVGLASLWLHGGSDRYGWWGLAVLAGLAGPLRAVGEPSGPAVLLAAALVRAIAWPAGAAGLRLTVGRVTAALGTAVAVGGLCAVSGRMPPLELIVAVALAGELAAVALAVRAGLDGLTLAALAIGPVATGL
jgi:hypothetical protein